MGNCSFLEKDIYLGNLLRQVASSGPTEMFENAVWFDESKTALVVDGKEPRPGGPDICKYKDD